MNIWMIVFLIITALVVIGVILWLVFVNKKAKLITKSSFVEMRKSFLSIGSLILLFAVSTSIAVGFQMSYERSQDQIDNLTIDHNMVHAQDPNTSINMNIKRLQKMNECSVVGIQDPTCGSDYGFSSGHAWADPYQKIDGQYITNEDIPTFIEWIYFLIDGTYTNGTPTQETFDILHDNLIFNVGGLTWNKHTDTDKNSDLNNPSRIEDVGIWSDKNVWGMQVYWLNVLNHFDKEFDDETYNSNMGFNIEVSFNVPWYQQKNNYFESGTLKVVKIPNKETSYWNQPATSDLEYGKEYHVDDIFYEQVSGSADYNKENNQMTLKDDEVVLLPIFAKNNKLKIDDEIIFGPNKDSYKIRGFGTRPGDIKERDTITSSGKDYEKYSVAFVSEDTFSDILEASIPNIYEDSSTTPEIGEPNTYRTREAMIESGFRSSAKYGFANIYSQVGNGSIDYLEDGSICTKYNEFFNKYDEVTYRGYRSTIQQIWKSEVPDSGIIAPDSTWNDGMDVPKKNAPEGSIIITVFANEWMNAPFHPNIRYMEALDSVNVQQMYGTIFLVVLVFINIVIIYIFIKRRISENIKNIATSKALGWNTSKVTMVYGMYPLTITLIGGILGIIGAIGVQVLIMSSLNSTIALGAGVIHMSFLSMFFAVIVPTIIVFGLTIVAIYINLKNNTMAVLQGETEGKPNIMVRGWSKITPPNFMISYRMKNILRSFGKSSFVLVTIIASSSLLLIGTSFSSWEQEAISITTESIGGQSDSLMQKEVTDSKIKEYVPQEELDVAVETGEITPYTFTEDPAGALVKSIGLLTVGATGSNGLDEWSNDIGNYMINTPMNDKYLSSGLDPNELLEWEPDVDSIVGFVGGITDYLESIVPRPKPDFYPGDLKAITDIGSELDAVIDFNPFAISWGPNAPTSITELIQRLFIVIEDHSKVGENCDGLNKIKCTTKEAAIQIMENKDEVLPEIYSLIVLISSVIDFENGYFPALLHGIAIKVAYNPDTYVPTVEDPDNPLEKPLEVELDGSNGSTETATFEQVTPNDIINKMVSVFVMDTVVSLTKNYEEPVRILPGKNSYTSNNNLGRFNLQSAKENVDTGEGMQLQWIYDKNFKQTDLPNLIEPNNKNYVEVTEDYTRDNIANKENGKVYIPKTISFMDKLTMPGWDHEIGRTSAHVMPASYLDWSREISSGNPDYTWIAQDFSHNEMMGKDEIEKSFKKDNGKMIVPVMHDENGEPECFGISTITVGVFEAYIPLGDKYWVSEDGLGMFFNETYYSANVISQEEVGLSGIFNNYQSFWTDEWDYEDKNLDNWMLLDANNDTMKQPINSWKTGIVIPVPLSILENYIQKSYASLQNSMDLFIVVSLIITIILITILTKEVVDSTKKEASVLKAIGYGDFKTSSLIIDGSNLVVIAGFGFSLWVTTALITGINTMLYSLSGLPVNMLISTAAMLNIFAFIAGIIALFYILSYITFRRVSPLEALKYQ